MVLELLSKGMDSESDRLGTEIQDSQQSERVTVEFEAYLKEENDDGSAWIDADGVELYVEKGEWSR